MSSGMNFIAWLPHLMFWEAVDIWSMSNITPNLLSITCFISPKIGNIDNQFIGFLS